MISILSLKFTIILIYVFQRVLELLLSKRNELYLKDNFKISELTNSDSLQMKSLHIIWFLSLITEVYLIKNNLNFPYGILTLLVLFQIIRLWSMKSLDYFWTIKNFNFTNADIKTSGVYRWMLHPNYFIVLLEFIFLPLLLKCYWTLFIFLPIKFFFLKKRIKIEEETLSIFSDYRQLKKNVKLKILFF